MISQAKNSTNFKKAVSFFQGLWEESTKTATNNKKWHEKEITEKKKSYKFSSKSPNADLLSKSKVLF